MIEIKSRLRKWGNSFGIVVPQKFIDAEKVKEGDEINILIRTNKPNLKKLFGGHKFNKPVNVLMKEIDEDLYND